MIDMMLWKTTLRGLGFLCATLAVAVTLLALDGVMFPSEAQAQRCDSTQGLRLCKGKYGRACYNPGLNEICVSGRICQFGQRVCEGIPCPSDEPNCKPEIEDSRSDSTTRVSCFDPRTQVCNRAYADRRVAQCPPGHNICDGIYGSECYDPNTRSCHSGRVCERFERLCEARGEARCYSPALNVCLVGAVCEIGQQLCRGNYGTTCYSPNSETCFEGQVCDKGERLCIGAETQFCHDVNKSCLDR